MPAASSPRVSRSTTRSRSLLPSVPITSWSGRTSSLAPTAGPSITVASATGASDAIDARSTSKIAGGSATSLPVERFDEEVDRAAAVEPDGERLVVGVPEGHGASVTRADDVQRLDDDRAPPRTRPTPSPPPRRPRSPPSPPPANAAPDPSTSTTRASATALPCPRHRSSSSRISRTQGTIPSPAAPGSEGLAAPYPPNQACGRRCEAGGGLGAEDTSEGQRIGTSVVRWRLHRQGKGHRISRSWLLRRRAARATASHKPLGLLRSPQSSDDPAPPVVRPRVSPSEARTPQLAREPWFRFPSEATSAARSAKDRSECPSTNSSTNGRAAAMPRARGS